MASAFRDRMLAATKVAQRQQRQIKARIARLYEECAQDMSREIARYGSDSLTGRRTAVVQKGMREYVRRLWREIESETAAGARISAGLGIEAQASMLDDLLEGLGITGKPTFKSVFGRTQDEAVASVLNGQIYSGKKAGLSSRIWNHEALMNGRIEQIIAANVAQGRSAIQLAKDLEAYVQPGAMMPDHWNDLYPIPFSFAVDYNAKRLAVTTLNHAYYQGTLMAARDNPFAEYLHWELSSFHLVYDVCDTYMEHDEGLGLGNFSLDNAPLPHPFCRCTWYIDSSKSLDEIGRELGDWISGGENAKLDRAFGEWKSTPIQIGWNQYQVALPGTEDSLIQPDDAMVVQVRQTVDRIIADFPELGKHLESIEFSPEPGIGAARIDGKVIRLDNSVFQNANTLKKVFDESVASGHTVHASDPMFIVAHECGHALESMAIARQTGIRITNITAREAFERAQESIGVSYFLHCGFENETTAEIYDIIEKELGGRALDSPSEMMAQAVATHYCGVDSYPIADMLVEYLKQLLRGKIEWPTI